MFIQTKQDKQSGLRQIMGVLLVVTSMSLVAVDRSLDLGLSGPSLASAQSSAPSNAQADPATRAGG